MSRTIQYVELKFKYSTVLVYNKIPSNNKLKKAIEETLVNHWHKNQEEILIKYLGESNNTARVKKIFEIICGNEDFDKYNLEVVITEMPVLTA